jgi:DNA-binding MarR family transcriptional regulator
MPASRPPDVGMPVAAKADLNLDAYFPYLINRVGVALATTFGKDPLGRHRLNIGMWRALAALSRNGGQRLVDLAGLTSIDVSTLSRMVTRLMRAGLVMRTRSKMSEREVVVMLTPKGRRLLDRLIPVARQFEAALTDGIAPADLAIVNRVLHRMHANMMQSPSMPRNNGSKGAAPRARK